MEINLTVILGMHRSGTSLLAAGLSHCGLNFGDELMGGTKFNLKGHWEDNDIVAFNNRVLQELGLKWDSLDFIPNDAWESNAIATLVDEGSLLLNSKLALSNGNFAFKDPRTVRVLPIWLKIFKQANIKPNYVFIIRSPLDVAKSLSKRESKPTSLSQLIWLHHNIGQIEALSAYDQQFFIIDFYDFCKEPKNVLLRLSTQLSLAVSENKLDEFSDEFYDEKLVSQQTDPYQLSENNKIFRFVFDTYRQLRAFANSKSSNLEPLQKLERFWQSVGPYLCEQHMILHEENLSNQQALRERQAEKINSIKKCNEDDAKLLALTQILNEFAGLKSELSTGFNRQFSLLQGNYSEASDKAINRQEQLFSYLNDEHADFKKMLANHISKNTQAAIENSKLQGELLQAEMKLENTTKALITKKGEVEAFQNSFSWKLTSPLRSIFTFFRFKS
ncbi:MAG: sulfotransferase family protein [Thalassotalea sp.]